MRHWTELDDHTPMPDPSDDFTDREKRLINWVVAILVIAGLIVLQSVCGPMDAPSPNTIGLKDLR